MDAVIPRPAHRTAAAAATDGALSVAGPWRIRVADDRLTAVAGTVRALLEAHLGDRLTPQGPDDDALPAGATLTLVLDGEAPAPGRAPVGVSPCGAARLWTSPIA